MPVEMRYDVLRSNLTRKFWKSQDGVSHKNGSEQPSPIARVGYQVNAVGRNKSAQFRLRLAVPERRGLVPAYPKIKDRRRTNSSALSQHKCWVNRCLSPKLQ